MNKVVYIFLSDGFEESEAVCVFDLFKRAKYDVLLISINSSLSVISSHGLEVKADKTLKEVLSTSPDAVYLPGGMNGAKSLSLSLELKRMLLRLNSEDKIISSICASPSLVLGNFGLLRGHKATCYPGCERFCSGFKFSSDGVVASGNIITGKSAGWAYDLALEIISLLSGNDEKNRIKEEICYRDNK